MDISGKNVFYAVQRTVSAKDLKTGSTIENDLDKDTLFSQYLFKIAANYGYESSNVENTARINTFNIHSLTFHNNQLYVCVRFLLANKLNRTTNKFGLITMDEKLVPTNYFSFNSDTGIFMLNVLAYHPIEFKDEKTIYVQNYKSKWMVHEFELNPKNHRIFKGKTVGEINFHKDSLLMMIFSTENYIMNPVFYIVPNTNSEYFFVHPFPVLLKSNNGKQCADPYHLNRRLQNSYNSYMKSREVVGEYFKNLFFENEYLRYGNIILTSGQWNDTIFMVVSDKEKGVVNIIRYNMLNGTFSTNQIAVANESIYFTIRKNELYQLSVNKGVITKYKL